MLDHHLKWRSHIHEISKMIARGLGILSRIRYFVNINILIQLCYSLIYPCLTYGLITWGNTYQSAVHPLFILQKKAIRLITHSRFDEHSNPLFRRLEILKFNDLIFLHNAQFLHQFHTGLLPNEFADFFTLVRNRDSYNTRLASRSSYCFPEIRTNYGKFNLRFRGATIWNSMQGQTKLLSSKAFKNKLNYNFIASY